MSSLTLQTDVIEKTLSDVDSLITKVELVDFFEKEEWTDQRSLSFRLWMSNPEKTMEKEEIDMVMQKAVNSVEKLGAKLRG